MAIVIDGISVSNVAEQDELQRIDTQLRALILTPESSLPGSRGFGLPYDFMDVIPAESVNLFAVELEEKVQEFIPGIQIAEVKMEATMDGDVRIKIFVEGSEVEDDQ